jgi:hypothetical protein
MSAAPTVTEQAERAMGEREALRAELLPMLAPAIAALQGGELEKISVVPRAGGGFDIIAEKRPLIVSLERFSKMVSARGYSVENLKRLYRAGVIRRGIAQPNGGEWICNPALLMKELLNLA